MSNENINEEKSVKNAKCLLNRKFYSPTIRLTVSLREPDEESCSVFNFISLITEEKRNRRREKEKRALNGSLEENEEEDSEVKKLAQHFEEKYGGVNTKKKKKKKAPTFYNYSELASGYDESDSFIDNSEAFDEALPDEMETFHGGYYVNCGQLEFKKVEHCDDNSDLDEIRVGKKKQLCVLKSDESASDAETVKSDDDKTMTEEEDTELVSKKLPEETDHEEVENESYRNHVVEAVNPAEITKVENIKDCMNIKIKVNGDVLKKKRKKYKKRRLNIDDADDQLDSLSKPKKKSLTVKSLLEEKRVIENGENGSITIKSVENYHNSINDVIESVVNAARNHSEDSRDSMTSSFDSKSVDSRTSYETEKESHVDDVETAESTSSISGASSIPKEQIKLPDNIPSEVQELISQIKKSAQTSDSGVRSFFNSFVNSKLLNLEIKSRPLMSNKRHALYDYLASFLPCSKDTLMKRAKKLLLEEEERITSEPLKKLKASIEKIMPSLMDNYTAACQQVAEEKNVNETIKNGDIDERKNISSKLPVKKFKWTEETRGYLRDLVACRLKCFQILKPRKESSDEYVKKFLETKVKPLWPVGWMETSILIKEAQMNSISNKIRKTSSANSTSVNTSNSTANTKKSHSTVPNISSLNNYNFLANSMALQSLAMQYPVQSELNYSTAPSTGIPYHPDLNMIAAAAVGLTPQPSSLSLSQMDILSQIAMVNTKYPGNHSYAKCTSPPKKQSVPSPSFSSQRSTTPVSASASNTSSVSEKKKSNDTVASKINDMSNVFPKHTTDVFKIDSLINSTKTKKEHHMLNHISQYNKHYSHKTEKKNTYEKKDENVPSVSPVSHSSSSNHSISNICSKPAVPGGCAGASANIDLGQNKIGIRDQVLDLSPNKIVKNEVECDNTIRKSAHHSSSKNEISTSIAASSAVTAKDHNYWSSTGKKEEITIKKEEVRQEAFPIISASASNPETSGYPNTNPKPTHISRKQRLLQESAKSVIQETVPLKSPASDLSTSSLTDSTESGAQLIFPAVEMLLKKTESQSSTALKNDEKALFLSSSVPEENASHSEPATAADLLDKVINDSLQGNSMLPHFSSNYERPNSPSLKRRSWERSSSPPSKRRNWSTECSSSSPPNKHGWVDSSNPPNTTSSNTLNWTLELHRSPTSVSPPIKKLQPLTSPQRRSCGHDNPPSPRRRSNSILDFLMGESETSRNEDRDVPSIENSDVKLGPSSRNSSHAPVPSLLNTERKSSTSSDWAEREAAEVIKDLLVLNQIGGHAIPRRMDYPDSKRRSDSDLNDNNGSSTNQSSLLNSDKNVSSTIPRMNLSGFQDEFFKHIFKQNDRSSSTTYINTSKSQDNCFTSGLPSLENERPASLTHASTPSPPVQGNSNMYNYQQSVIMPPASVKWHAPESKS